MNTEKEGRSFKIDKKIYLLFFALILIAITNAIVSTYTIEKSKQITNEIESITNPSLARLFEMNQLVTKSQMYITNWVYLRGGGGEKEALADLNQKMLPVVKNKLLSLSELWNDPRGAERIKKIFDDYETLIIYENQIVGELATLDDYQDPIKKFTAEDILETRVTPNARTIIEQLSQITEQKKTEAAIKQNKMLLSFSLLGMVVVGLATLIIIAVIAITYFMSTNIIGPVMKMREIILQLSLGELPNFKFKMPKNAVGEMMLAIGHLMAGLRRTSQFAKEIGTGNFSSHFEPLSPNDVQGKALIEMCDRLKSANEADASRNWTSEGIALMGNVLQRHSDSLRDLADEIVMTIVNYVGIHEACILIIDKNDSVNKPLGLYGFCRQDKTGPPANRGELNHDLVEKCITSKQKIFTPGKSDSFPQIDRGGDSSATGFLLILPLIAAGRSLGVFEIVSLHELSKIKLEFLEKITERIALSLYSVRANLLTKQLLEDSIKQADELAAQKQDLRWANEELTSKSKLLELSQSELTVQQDELKQMNAELEMKAQLLQEQNIAIEEARQSLAFKARQLEQSSKYKSSFLANMSHELRTPLNSVLILAKLLAENKLQNLSEKQIEHAKVIHKSGSDLLLLINDILDLSKIEAGKIELHNEQFGVSELAADMQMLFKELANEKAIGFDVTVAPDFPKQLFSDQLRLSQIVKNLLSNAFKFTPKGGKVILAFDYAPKDSIYKNKLLYKTSKVLSVSVSDTGIGIPEDKQKLIFEAFQQADGSTSRKYGGTGLGLAISKELSHLLGGDLVLYSVENSGSVFTIYLPYLVSPETDTLINGARTIEGGLKNDSAKSSRQYVSSVPFKNNEIHDDRNLLSGRDKKVLIIEDDILFAKMLFDRCHDFGCKGIVAMQGDDGLNYADLFNPDLIILDMQLPVVDGWSVLKQLKHDDATKTNPCIYYFCNGQKTFRYRYGRCRLSDKACAKK